MGIDQGGSEYPPSQLIAKLPTNLETGTHPTCPRENEERIRSGRSDGRMSAKAKEVGGANNARNRFGTNERSPNQWSGFHGEGSITFAEKKSSRGGGTRWRPERAYRRENLSVSTQQWWQWGGRPIKWRDYLRNERKQITKGIT
jgi:hypothetical protein